MSSALRQAKTHYIECCRAGCSVDSMSEFRVQMNTIIFSVHHIRLVTAFVFGKMCLMRNDEAHVHSMLNLFGVSLWYLETCDVFSRCTLREYGVFQDRDIKLLQNKSVYSSLSLYLLMILVKINAEIWFMQNSKLFMIRDLCIIRIYTIILPTNSKVKFCILYSCIGKHVCPKHVGFNCISKPISISLCAFVGKIIVYIACYC